MPIEIRSSNRKRKLEVKVEDTFLNLKDYSFSGVEKTFACKELMGPQGDDLLLKPTGYHCITGKAMLHINKFCQRHEISEHTVKDWIKKTRAGQILYDCNQRRPAEVDAVALKELQETVEHAEVNGNASLTADDINKLLSEAKGKTMKRKNKLDGNFALVKRKGEEEKLWIPVADLTLDEKTLAY